MGSCNRPYFPGYVYAVTIHHCKPMYLFRGTEGKDCGRSRFVFQQEIEQSMLNFGGSACDRATSYIQRHALLFPIGFAAIIDLKFSAAHHWSFRSWSYLLRCNSRLINAIKVQFFYCFGNSKQGTSGRDVFG